MISCTDFDLIGMHNEVLMRSLAVKFSSVKELVRALFTFCPINGCTIMMHRSVPERLGLFNEGLVCTQDYEYWLRIFLAHIDFHYINETLTAYRWHEGMGTRKRKELADREFAWVRDQYSPHMQALLQILQRMGLEKMPKRVLFVFVLPSGRVDTLNRMRIQALAGRKYSAVISGTGCFFSCANCRTR